MKRVLITGIDSFTGRHLKDHLEHYGYQVFGTSLFETDTRIFRCDLTRKEEIEAILKQESFDYVIHLAAISFVAHDEAEAFYRVNTVGTLNLLESLARRESLPRKVILASSATVYGRQKREVLEETLCPHPANHYGASKHAMETLAENFFGKLPLLITRPFNYTGPGQAEQFLIPKIVAHFRRKERVIELGNLEVVREFNDVEFVCEAYRRLLESEQKGECFNLCSGRGIRLMDVVEKMEEIAGYPIEVHVNPAFVRSDEIPRLIGSPRKLFAAIGEIPQKPLEETLRAMYR